MNREVALERLVWVGNLSHVGMPAGDRPSIDKLFPPERWWRGNGAVNSLES